MYLVLTFAGCGDLLSRMEDNDGPIDEVSARLATAEITAALCHLHERRILDVRAQEVDGVHSGHEALLVGAVRVGRHHRAAINVIEVVEAVARAPLHPQPARADERLSDTRPWLVEVDLPRGRLGMRVPLPRGSRN